MHSIARQKSRHFRTRKGFCPPGSELSTGYKLWAITAMTWSAGEWLFECSSHVSRPHHSTSSSSSRRSSYDNWTASFSRRIPVVVVVVTSAIPRHSFPPLDCILCVDSRRAKVLLRLFRHQWRCRRGANATLPRFVDLCFTIKMINKTTTLTQKQT